MHKGFIAPPQASRFLPRAGQQVPPPPLTRALSTLPGLLATGKAMRAPTKAPYWPTCRRRLERCSIERHHELVGAWVESHELAFCWEGVHVHQRPRRAVIDQYVVPRQRDRGDFVQGGDHDHVAEDAAFEGVDLEHDVAVGGVEGDELVAGDVRQARGRIHHDRWDFGKSAVEGWLPPPRSSRSPPRRWSHMPGASCTRRQRPCPSPGPPRCCPLGYPRETFTTTAPVRTSTPSSLGPNAMP